VFLLAEVPLSGALPLGALLVAEGEMESVVPGFLEKKDTGGGEGVAVFWHFACDLVLLELFLFS